MEAKKSASGSPADEKNAGDGVFSITYDRYNQCYAKIRNLFALVASSN